MNVYKVTSSDDQDFTYVVARNLQEVFTLLGDHGLEFDEEEEYPLTVEVCDREEEIDIYYDDEPWAIPPGAEFNEDELCIHSTAGQWLDFFADREEGSPISSARWAP